MSFVNNENKSLNVSVHVLRSDWPSVQHQFCIVIFLIYDVEWTLAFKYSNVSVHVFLSNWPERSNHTSFANQWIFRNQGFASEGWVIKVIIFTSSNALVIKLRRIWRWTTKIYRLLYLFNYLFTFFIYIYFLLTWGIDRITWNHHLFDFKSFLHHFRI